MMPSSSEMWCVIPIDKKLGRKNVLGGWYFFDCNERDKFMTEVRRQRPHIIFDFFPINAHYDYTTAVNSFTECYVSTLELIARANGDDE